MWFLRIWGAVFGVAGALLAGLAVRNFVRGSANKRWPQTQGHVLRSFVLVDSQPDEGEGYTPRVEYEYVVEGKTYRGTRLRYGQTGSWSRKHAERTIARFAAGAGTPVFFNPRNPADAVLICGTSWGNLAIALSGLVFLLSAYLMQVHAR